MENDVRYVLGAVIYLRGKTKPRGYFLQSVTPVRYTNEENHALHFASVAASRSVVPFVREQTNRSSNMRVAELTSVPIQGI